ncbi:MAG: PIN domain-containing protein [Blastocatellia bacterium]
MIYVLDATAMIAFLTNEPGADVIEDLLTEPGSSCLAHAINLCELWYQAYRIGGDAAADQVISVLASIGIATRSDMDVAFWREAGRLKGMQRMSLADAFGLALTLRVGGEFVSSDHHELDPVAASGVCPVRFFR